MSEPELAWLNALERNRGSYPLSGVSRPRNERVRGVVIHHAEGAPSLSGNLTYAKQEKVGADIYILPDGSYVYATAPGRRMDHAGIKNNSRYTNGNTMSIEVITTKNGMPNAAQYKTAHGLVSQLSYEHGFDVTRDVVAHGDIAPGHKNAREGRGIVETIRTAGLYTEGNDGLYESSSQRYSDGRPVMRAQVHPVDLGQPHKGYSPHADGSMPTKHEGDLKIASGGPNKNLHVFAKQKDPFDVFAEKQRFQQEELLDANVEASGITDSTFLAPEGSPSGLANMSVAPLASGLTSTSLNEEAPAYEVSATDTPSVSNEAINAITNPSPLNMTTADVVREGNLGSPPVSDPLQERHFETAKRYGIEQSVIEEERLKSAQTYEQDAIASSMPMPPPFDVSRIFKTGPGMTAQTQNRLGLQNEARQALAESTPELLSYLNTQFNSNNSLVNLVDDAVQNVYNKVRQTYDPAFRIPEEDLNKYPEHTHSYLLQANNAEDYVERTFEIQRRMEGEAVAQRAFDNSSLMWGAGYFTSGIVTMIPYMVVGGGVGAAVTRALPTGVSFTRYMLTATAADAAVFAPEQYAGMKAGVYSGTDIGMQLVFGAAGSAIAARFITKNAKLQAQYLEAADETAYTAAKAAHQARKTKMKTDAEEVAEDGLNELHQPRPIVDEESSLELIRNPATAPEAVARYKEDSNDIANWVEIQRSGNRMTPEVRALGEAAFERQKHIHTKDRAGYMRIPKGFTPEAYVKQLMEKGEVIYLSRKATEVLRESDSSLLKISIPAGREHLNTRKIGSGTKGSLAIRPSSLIPNVRGKKRDKAWAPNLRNKYGINTLDEPQPLATRTAKTSSGPVRSFNQTDLVLDAADFRGTHKKQWVKLTAHGMEQEARLVDHVNGLKVTKGVDFDQAKAFEGVPDWMLKSETYGGKPANLSAGVLSAKADADISPVRRLNPRLTPTSKIVENFFKEQEMFTGRKVPWGLGQNSIFRALLPTGLRAEGDPNALFRGMMRKVVEVGYNPTRKELDEGIGNGPSVDRLAQNVIGSMDGRIQNHAVKNFEIYRQARAKADGASKRFRPMGLERGWIKDFNESVNDYRRGLQNLGMPNAELVKDPKYAGIKEYSHELDMYYKDMLDLAQDPGALIGRSKEFPALEGFEDTEWRPGYTPRLWNRDLIREVDDRLKDIFDTTDVDDLDLRGMSPLQYYLSDAMFDAGTLQQSKHMQEWARRKARLSDGSKIDKKPVTLMTPAEQQAITSVMRKKYDEMAKTMGDTILRSKEKNTVDVQLLLGSFTNKKWLELLKDEFGTHGRAWDADFEAAMKQEIDDILKVGTFKDASGNTKADNAGKSGRHSHHRAILNEATIARPGKGIELTLKDFVNTDQTQIARGYLRRMGGRIAWGSFEYQSPGKGIHIKGIGSDKAFKTQFADPVKEVEMSVGGGRKDQVIGASGDKSYIEQELNSLWAATTGAQPVGSEYLSMIQNWSYFAHLGNAGLSQATEAGNMLGSVGFQHIAAAQPYKDASAAMRMARSKGDYDSLDGVAAYLMDDGIGFDYVRGAMGSQLDERMGQHAGQGLGSKAMRNTSEALEKGARFVGISSGLTPFQQQMQWTHGRASFNRVGHMAHKYASWEQMSRRHKQDFVQMFGDIPMAERVFKMAKKDFVTEDAYGVKRVIEVNEAAKDFDTEAFRRMRNGIKQRTEQNVQTNSYGTSHRWFQNPTVRALMTLKTFIYGSFTKQLLRNGRDASSLIGQAAGDIKQGNFSSENGLGDTTMSMVGTGGAIMYSMALGALGWSAMSELKMIGKTEEEAEEWRTKNYTESNLAMAGFQRSGITGLIPTIWNTPAQMFSSDMTLGMEGFKGSGLDASFTGIPALQDTGRLAKGIYDVATFPMNEDAEWNRENFNRTHQLLTNQWTYAAILNATGGILFED